jgi:hypothetical protein
MESLILICLKEVQSILNVGNFCDLYQVVFDSDVLHEHRLLRQMLNHYYSTHSNEITILDKSVKRSLLAENAPEISVPNYMEEIQTLKSKLFQTGEFADITVKSKEGKPFLLHKCIVRNVEYFDLLLKHPWEKGEMLPFSANALKICFGFIYDGQTFLKDVPFLILFEIYAFAQFADQALLDVLKKKALAYLDSFSLSNMITKIPPEHLCQVYNDENCGEEMKERVTKIMMQKIDKESSLLWVHLFAQFDITKEEEPKLWNSLELVRDKNVHGMYLILRNLKEENETLKSVRDKK